MQRVIVSPHHDDAVFSLAETMMHVGLGADDDWLIVTPFAAAISDNPRHVQKIETLQAEHLQVVGMLGARHIEGPFVDDGVRSDPVEISRLTEWLEDVCDDGEVWAPLGIHHPDHVDTRTALDLSALTIRVFYEELPYRVLYPELAEQHRCDLSKWATISPLETGRALSFKRPLVEAYRSQYGGDIERCCFAPERAWRLT